MMLTIIRDVTGLQCSLDIPIAEAVEVLERNHGGTVFCVDEDRTLRGTLTDGDVRRFLIRGGALSSSVQDAMNTKFLSCLETDSAAAAQTVISKNKITALPIVAKGGKLIGYYTSREESGQRKEELSTSVVPVIMAGGKGTRLLPLTTNCPKPLLKIGGKPILQIILEQIAAAGFSKAVITVGYLANMIVDYFGAGDDFGLELSYLHEDEPLGTAGVLSRLDRQPGLSYLVINGDVLSSLNLQSLIRFHIDSHADLTVASRIIETSIPYGVLLDSDGLVTAIREKPTVAHKISAGVYVINSQLVELIPPVGEYNMPDLIQACLESRRRVLNFPIHEQWIDIGLPHTLLQANEQWT
jgi:dTDP-glucose pyrophosphorylase